MGEGLQKAVAAALATQLTAEARRFLRTLSEWGGAACREDLQRSPSNSETQKARQQCRRLGFAYYEAGYWWLTEDGRRALAGRE